jgi:hypothetical protein
MFGKLKNQNAEKPKIFDLQYFSRMLEAKLWHSKLPIPNSQLGTRNSELGT